MRSARADRSWRRAIEHDRAFRVSRVRAIGKAPLLDLDEALSNGLTIVCGLNGVGKTTLLRLVEASLAGAASVTDRARPDVLTGGTFIVTAQVDGTTVDYPLGSDPTPPVNVVLLDAFDICGRLQSVGSQPNFRDLLEGVESRVYSSDERATAGYVVGRAYDTLRVYEVEEPGTDEERVLPVFEASSGGTEYDFLAMGLGELAALAMLWHLDRVAPSSVVLLEEPETFLSSRSTVALMDVLAARIDAKRLYAVVTTHSVEFAARAPLDAIRILVTSPGGASIRRPVSRAELDHLLGSYIGQPRLLVVEDRTAGVFASELLARDGGIWGEGIDVVSANGASGVTAACTHFPSSTVVRIVGVLDGDQPDPEPEATWPIVKLPGPEAPDELLRAAARDNRELFATRLDRDIEQLNVALAPLDGADAHDWFEELATALGLDPVTVIRAAVHCWTAVNENQQRGEAFADSVTAALIA